MGTTVSARSLESSITPSAARSDEQPPRRDVVMFDKASLLQGVAEHHPGSHPPMGPTNDKVGVAEALVMMVRRPAELRHRASGVAKTLKMVL